MKSAGFSPMFSPARYMGLGGGSSLLGGLVAYYAMETLTLDSTGRGNTLTNNNGVTQAVGINGQGANFVAASSQYLSVASNPDISQSNNDWTLAFWVNFTLFGSVIIGKATGAIGGGGYYVQTSSGRSGQLVIFNIVSASEIITAGTGFISISAGTWHLGVAVIDKSNSQIKFYWDNQLKQTTVLSSNPVANSQPLALGCLPAVPNNFHEGLLDEVGIWNRAWTAGDVALFWNGGAGITYPFFGIV